jgi:Astacin (Peptidase family M12A)
MGIVSSKPERRWPGRRIPFVIDDDDFPPGSPQRAMVQAAIATWNLQTFAPLVDRSDESDYVRFREGAADLHSRVGRQGGEQGVYCDVGGSRQQRIPEPAEQGGTRARVDARAIAHGSPRRFVERSMAFHVARVGTDAAKKFGPAHGRRRNEFCAINTGAQWLTVSRISATSSTDRAVVDAVSCRLGA